MAELTLVGLGLVEGVWRGRLTGAASAPDLAVTHEGTPLPGIELKPEGKGAFVLSVPVPTATLSDGVQTYLVTEAKSGARIGSFAIVAGTPLDGDLRAEIDLLRAELDTLRKAFRRFAAGNG